MGKKQWVIIGGGISALSLLWYLRKYAPENSIHLLEKSSRLGGVIHASFEEDIVFNEGPKTFRRAQGKDLLELICELELQDQLVFSSKEIAKRYIYYQDKLHKVPSNPLALLTSSFGRKILPGLWQDLKAPKGNFKEESLGTFMRRRFGSYITDVLMEPLILGTSGGDIDELSVDVFAQLKKWEQEKGSVIKGYLTREKKGSKDSTLFNLQGGAFTLIKELYARCQDSVYLNQEVQEIQQVEERVVVKTQDREFLADRVFLALPVTSLQKMRLPLQLQEDPFIEKATSANFVSVMCAYHDAVLPVKGFGCLIPSSEKKSILGVVFDSEIFPSTSSYQTQLTVIMGGVKNPYLIQQDPKQIISQASEGLKMCLAITAKPVKTHIVKYTQAIPQYTLGYFSRLDTFKKRIEQAALPLTLVGNSIVQASVNHCVALSKKTALEAIHA